MSRRPGRLALLGVAAAYAVGLVWAALVLPERVPSHFDASGQVDDWTSRTAMLVFWVVVGAVVLAGIPALTRLAVSGDGTWVNMPQRSKDHWFAPERRAAFRVRFGDDMEALAALTGALLVAALAVTTWVGATGRDGAPWWTFVAGLAVYLLLTAWWTVAPLPAARGTRSLRGRSQLHDFWFRRRSPGHEVAMRPIAINQRALRAAQEELSSAREDLRAALGDVHHPADDFPQRDLLVEGVRSLVEDAEQVARKCRTLASAIDDSVLDFDELDVMVGQAATFAAQLDQVGGPEGMGPR